MSFLTTLVAAASLLCWNSATADDAAGGKAVPLVRTVEGFSDWINSLAFAPDGNALAVGSYELIRIVDSQTGETQRDIRVPAGQVRAVAFSPSGEQLAAGFYQGAALWNPVTGEQIRTLEGHRGYVTSVTFSSQGALLATSSEDGSIRIWDAQSGAVRHTLNGHRDPVLGVAFSPDGQTLASAAGDETRITRKGEVKLWDVATGQELRTLPPHKRAATSVAFSPDGKLLASTSIDETVNVYSPGNGEALGFFGKHGRPTNAVLFMSDSSTVISAAGGRAKGHNEVKIWDAATGEEKATLGDHSAKVSAIALSPSQRLLASGGYDNVVHLWDTSNFASAASTAEPAGTATVAAAEVAQAQDVADAKNAQKQELRIGIIGLDTSHAVAFTTQFNKENPAPEFAGCRVVAAYPKGSPDIESSVSRVPKYTETVKDLGVEIVDSIPALLEKVDVVLLETNDGRPHLEQVIPVFQAGKTVFIDKPIAGSLTDAVAIFELSKQYDVPVFSSSSLRYSQGAQALREGKLGKIIGCDAYSPCSLEATHPDLFWYGIHGVETLFTVMGTGCERVTRASTEGTDVVVGVWDGGRIGTFRGIREGRGGYGGTAFGEKGIAEIGKYDGYNPLLVEIVKFFRTGKPPVSEQETLEIYAFMEAADESKRQGGVPVTLESVMEKAQTAAQEIVQQHKK